MVPAIDRLSKVSSELNIFVYSCDYFRLNIPFVETIEGVKIKESGEEKGEERKEISR